MLGTMAEGMIVSDTEKEVEWRGEPLKATTAHFGLTVLNLEKLATVPKPWFISKPNEKGEWDIGHIDDDVHFWLNWKEAGNTVYIDPGVRIGHVEEMVTMFDENLQQIHIYPKEWEETYGR